MNVRSPAWCARMRLQKNTASNLSSGRAALNAERVEIFRRGDEIVLRKQPVNAAAIFDLLAELPDDFRRWGEACEAQPCSA